MRFCNLNTFLSSLRQGIAFHSTVVLKLVLDVYIATCTSTIQATVPLSAYPLAFPKALASEAILSPDGLRLATYSQIRPILESVSGGYFVPNFPFVAGFRILSLHRVYCECLLVCRIISQPPILTFLGQAYQPFGLFCITMIQSRDSSDYP
jgi:hypothetical protein